MNKKRQLLWDWVEFKNGHKNTDIIGFMAISDNVVDELLEEAKEDKRYSSYICVHHK